MGGKKKGGMGKGGKGGKKKESSEAPDDHVKILNAQLQTLQQKLSKYNQLQLKRKQMFVRLRKTKSKRGTLL